jgi:sialic acid synthase SpsE
MILDRRIGAAEPAFVIAEVGVNHDGSLGRALELVEAAARCGADAVKLQLFSARALMHGSSEFAEYQQAHGGEEDADPAEMLQRYELPPVEVACIVEAIRAKGMVPLATPFSVGEVEAIESLDLPAVKIASPDVVNRPLLRRAAQSGRPLLVSTGAATMQEVERSVNWLREWGAAFALLHCVSSYPATDEDAHLCWINEIAVRFRCPVGYSDHTTDMMAGALAVASGACIVEKHLTYDRRAEGPDHAASADAEQFVQYVRLVRRAEVMRGRQGKRVLAAEQDLRRVSRQSLVLRRALGAGEQVREGDLIVQRPGTGISAAEADRVLGRRAVRRLAEGTLLQWGMLTDAA